ncbi:MAG: diaminopimelate decarboxylase [Deltaproteobacteria bacterium]|jgi:diaminopimelate decarboxylase|nr:diaminopimelate decarboxylase [Deltaproteobacteria bacterium]
MLPDFFSYKNGSLSVEDVSLGELADARGTPLFVYSREAFLSGLKALENAFRDTRHLICYSVKAASNLALLKLVADNGMGADIVSGGELHRALKAGIPGGRIVFSGVGKTKKEMSEALDAGIFMFNMESAGEMAALAEVSADKGLVAPAAFRVNPDVDPKTHPYVATGLRESKFGIPLGEALDLFLEAKKLPSLKIIGLDCHIGSQLTDAAPFRDAVTILAGLLSDLKTHGVNIRYLDIGGGLGITYRDEKPPSPEAYAAAVTGIASGFPGLTLILEPGRSVSGNSCVFLTRVLYDKKTPAKNFAIVDGAMNDLIRPSLYGSYHRVATVTEKSGGEIPVTVVGPVCESGDFLAKDRPLPPLEPGELLAFFGAGAYGFSMSSNYNSRPRAAEILVEGSTHKVIRARETYEDLIRGEIPA